MRHLPDEKVFAESWKPLQGPAFCVFNDKPFTDKDINGIQNLGEGSKSEDTTKIGQYGVGFNCVYHLTDVPTFLTSSEKHGKVLLALDPLVQYVPQATSDSKGFMYHTIDTLKNQFPDVFCGYLEKEYGFGDSGTLFRFPLRLKTSELSSNVLKIEQLINMLFNSTMEEKEELQECLLFLNNVKEIKIREIKSDSTDITDIFSVTAMIEKDSLKKLNSFNEKCKKIASDIKLKLRNVGNIEATADHIICYEMSTCVTGEDQWNRWIICQQIGYRYYTDYTDSFSHFLNDVNRFAKDLNLLPRAGVAYRLNENYADQKQKRKLFCFLPLPKKIQIPVHVNGYFALDHENRRNLWEHYRGDSSNDFKTDWNEKLMQNVVASAYCFLIKWMRDYSKNNIEVDFYSVFPNVGEQDGKYVHTMCCQVYRILHETNEPVLLVITSRTELLWVGTRGDKSGKAYFKNILKVQHLHNLYSEEVVSKKVKKLENLHNTLTACGLRLTQAPLDIHRNFRASGMSVDKLNPAAVLEFFKNFNQFHSSCKLHNLPKLIHQTPLKDVYELKNILKFCLKDCNNQEKLDGTPLVLSEDGYLRVFDESSPLFESFSNTCPHAPQKFLHPEFIGMFFLCKAVKSFEISDFLSLIPDLLDVQTFKQELNFSDFDLLNEALQKKTLCWHSQ